LSRRSPSEDIDFIKKETEKRNYNAICRAANTIPRGG
jgi:hypothetical protein